MMHELSLCLYKLYQARKEYHISLLHIPVYMHACNDKLWRNKWSMHDEGARIKVEDTIVQCCKA